MISDSDFNFVSQNAHVLGGIVAMLIPNLFWGPHYFLYITVAMVIFATKEFWYDFKYETPEVRGSSLEDFLFYCVGILTGNLLIYFS